ncbi:hypothetical protein [Chryseobacterium sp. Leaf201]|uniref:hypothetical protein n=1 Tax=Chryseobacterium sp. Leaf201 TaxID=1735672 RepID=UPI0006FB824E|nr:hypothetical protein [Chryseobacterium sp. Leaf201]KQM41776.1 hypothetical protein ASE55_13485 [Chryseobacterium sp. Leaf201]
MNKTINLAYFLICIIIITSCASNKSVQTNTDRENFNKQFFTNKLFYGAMKKKFKDKKEISILDSDHLITNKPVVYFNKEIKIGVSDNNSLENDLYAKYYIINSDLAYVVFWANSIEGISFIVVNSKQDKNKWNILDVTYRNTR